MQVDNAHSCSCDTKQQQQPQAVQHPAVGEQFKADNNEARPAPAEARDMKDQHADTAMQSEELPDGAITSSKEASVTTQTPKVSRISESELDALYASLEAMKKELTQVRQKERANAAAVHDLKVMERERDKYRAVSIEFLLTVSNCGTSC